MANKKISKSQYTRGLQCVKSLWLYNYRKDLMGEVSASQQAIFDQGNEVGDWARKYYKGGVMLAQYHTDIAGALKGTQELIAKGANLLYEAAFQAEGVLVRCDILRKVGKAWHLIEVKSSTELKEQHLGDIAIQKYVLEAAGIKVAKAFLMVIDTSYVKKGPIDPKQLFKLEDVTEAIEDAEAAVPGTLKEFFKILSNDSKEPAIEIGGRCSDPYECDFCSYCWKEIPAHSVYNLPRLDGEIKDDLRRKGILELKDFPEDIDLCSAAADYVTVAKTGKPIIMPEPIREFVEALEYPLYHLDFETINPAVPLYDGLRPYMQMPFQASLHIQQQPGGPVKHLEYLADAKKDPRPDIVDFLLKSIGLTGTPLAYCAGFEKSVIKGLAEFSPRHAKKLLALADRFVDLASPFRARHVLLPEFQGSFSMKAVLPALVPTMTYEGMAVANGGDAQNAYKALLSGKLTTKEEVQLRKDLITYCGQDTLAMVKILEHLQKIA
ncbi:MAG: DUF2779 domain-containing protein [Elusimicrobia bacterium]|nr:DUF2779 domain-containing protein [Elusimicrobiota bacterium]